MKSNHEQFDLPTVTHQNGFGSTMLFGVPTFKSRITSVFRQSKYHVLFCMYLAFAVVQNAELSVKMKILTENFWANKDPDLQAQRKSVIFTIL
jgi:hypothetical protein